MFDWKYIKKGKENIMQTLTCHINNLKFKVVSSFLLQSCLWTRTGDELTGEYIAVLII